MYEITMPIVFFVLLIAVFKMAYNVHIQFKEKKEFDIEYRKEQERKGK